MENRKPKYENAMAQESGLICTCNSCSRIIYEDETLYPGGYCKECNLEVQEEMVKVHISTLAKIVKEEVQLIERSIQMTKGSYDRYMSLLNILAKDKQQAILLSAAMVEAGGNKFGVSWAFKLLYP